ncbi:YhdP family protein [Pseudohongiella spirulinae]|uniref:YhdP central domain-containing protein n=1 Tax=Pseudohongiella spirulinae TaxID=1249552 RepID=A0A0S2KAX3_9GAMM|nr:YhdP family protein [Pseudohongiella spirulinae]ALO45450.1 hypothetical protein PS2015_774 [Pseudohongiella spirulinae]
MIIQMARATGRWLLRVVFWTLLLMLVLLALYVSLGRQLTPSVSNYQADIEQRLSEALDAQVTLQSVTGQWQGFSPRFRLHGLRIAGGSRGAEQSHTALELDSIEIEADIPASFLQRKLVLATTRIDQLNLDFTQQPDGRWQLSGLGTGATPGVDVAQIFDWVTGLSNLNLRDAHLVFRPDAGAPLQLGNTQVQFQSRNNRYALFLSAQPDLAADLLQLSAELSGPTLAELQGRVYLNAPPAEYAELLTSLNLADLGADRLSLSSFQLFGQFWFELLQGQLTELIWQGGGQAELEVWDGDQQQVVERVLVDELAVDWLKYYRSPDSSWYLQTEGLGFQYDGGRWPSGGMIFDYFPDGSTRLHIDAVDTGLARRLITALLPEGPLRQEIDGFNVRGQLQNLVVNTLSDAQGLRQGQVVTNIVDGAIDAHQGVPAFWGIDGYAELDFDQAGGVYDGVVEVDAHEVAMHIPDLFTERWDYDHVNGRVSITARQQDELQLRLSSSVISVDSPAVTAHGQFGLDIQTGEDRLINLELMIGALQADVSQKSQYLPMAPRAPAAAQSVLRWVDEAVLSGNGAGSGFIFRGHVHAGSQPAERTMQMFFRVDDGHLMFDPQWPALESVSGTVTVLDGDVDVLADAGESVGIGFQQTQAQVRTQQGGGRWLTVSGTGQGSAAQGLQYLQQTPVTQEFAQYLANWQAQGDTEFTLSLNIPLSATDARPDVVLDMSFKDHQLYIPDYDLRAEGLSGLLRYSASDGLQSEDITATIMGRPADININSLPTDEGALLTQVAVSGDSDVATLLDWPGLPGVLKPVLSRASGTFSHRTTLRLGQTPELMITSDLNQVKLDFPAPFSKAADEDLPMTLGLEFAPSGTRVNMRLLNRLQTNLALSSDTGAISGLIFLGPAADGMRVRRLNPGAPGIEVLGRIDELNVEAWQQALTDMINISPGNSSLGTDQLLGTAGVTVGQLDVFGERFDNVSVSVNKTASAWDLGAQGDAVQGRLLIPVRPDQPWTADFDRLRLDIEVFDDVLETAQPALAEGSGQELDLQELPTVEYELPREDPLAGFDPRQLPYMRLNIAQLTLGDADFGSWSFLVRPDSSGALFSDLVLDVRGLGIGSEEEPAEFRWVYDGQQHRSALNGQVSATDLAPVLSAFGYAPSLESSSAIFDTRLHWDGSPAYFSALGLNGDIDLQVNNGRFRQRAGVANSALRLISIINFDSLVRRLRFSGDLARTGLSYDEITGRVNLSQGIVTIEDRLQIIGPASLFQLAGTVNLAEQTIDGDLYITLPVSDNIPWLGGLAVLNNLINWQLAVGVFIFDQIFGDQVDNLTSAHYRLEGPWDGLEPRLNQVFTGGGN